MSKKSLPSSEKTPKKVYIQRIVDHILECHKPRSGPVVITWPDLMNELIEKDNPNIPKVRHGERRVHAHWKQYGPGVFAKLQGMRMTVVKVNDRIRWNVKHGQPPVRAEGKPGDKRTDAAYELCLPTTSHMIAGIVIFPRDTGEDHPLILESRRRRCNAGASYVRNSVGSVDDANDLGNMSNDKRDAIIKDTGDKVRTTFEAVRYPLFQSLTGG